MPESASCSFFRGSNSNHPTRSLSIAVCQFSFDDNMFGFVSRIGKLMGRKKQKLSFDVRFFACQNRVVLKVTVISQNYLFL